jgi:hypothetical protein
MKVWLVWEEDARIKILRSVWNERGLALIERDRLREDDGDWYTVEEREVNRSDEP